MLTQQDIDDLKLYSDDYDKFCKDRTCDYRCEVFQKSKDNNTSCWKVFCEMKRTGKL